MSLRGYDLGSKVWALEAVHTPGPARNSPWRVHPPICGEFDPSHDAVTSDSTWSYTGVGTSGSAVVRVEKDTQVVMIMASLTEKHITLHLPTPCCPRLYIPLLLCVHTYANVTSSARQAENEMEQPEQYTVIQGM